MRLSILETRNEAHTNVSHFKFGELWPGNCVTNTRLKMHGLTSYLNLKNIVGGLWCERTTWDGLLSREEVLLWIMHSNFGKKQWLKFKTPYLFLINMKLFAFKIHFYQLFGLSFWWNPFTAEDQLMSKWCTVKFSKSVLMDIQTHLHLSWRGSTFLANIFFCMNYS